MRFRKKYLFFIFYCRRVPIITRSTGQQYRHRRNNMSPSANVVTVSFLFGFKINIYFQPHRLIIKFLFFGSIQTKPLLDLRYNEMWNDWDGTGERRRDSGRWFDDVPCEDGQLVLSWKRLNVYATITKHTFFGSSEVVHKQILRNGE